MIAESASDADYRIDQNCREKKTDRQELSKGLLQFRRSTHQNFENPSRCGEHAGYETPCKRHVNRANKGNSADRAEFPWGGNFRTGLR
jgi:hypothetical protein